MSIPDLNPHTATSSSAFRSPSRTTAVEHSDEDLFTVPDVESAGLSRLKAAGAAAAAASASASDVQLNAGSGGSGKPRKGRNLADREHRRLKRLLRNRVSAQQARERKKVYVNDLESRAKGLEDKNSKLEEKISTLIHENTMLRKVLMNTRPKVDEESVDPQNHQSGNS